MEMLKKRWVAVVILLLVIALSICIGLMKAPTGTGQPAVDQAQSLDTGLDTQSYTRFLYDKADLLSAQAEETICLYNANWDYRYNSVVDIQTLQHTNQQLISTLDEVMKIQQDGAQKRKEAELELGRIEGELKQKLLELRG